MKVYRIYDPVSKLYSAGGLHNNWTKNGKTWTEAGLKGHINCVKRHASYRCKDQLEMYAACVVHEFESEPVVIEIEKYLTLDI